MKIKPVNVEYWPQDNIVTHIAKCARVCYASTAISNNTSFCDSLWRNNHRSMFRHAAVYYIIPQRLNIPFESYVGATIKLVDSKYYVSTNEQCAREYWDKYYSQYRVSIDEAKHNKVFTENKMLRYTFCIETGIDITREFNRKSPNNIAEQSTRYVDFNKRVGINFKLCHWMRNLNPYKYCLVRIMTKCAEWFYKLSRSKYGLNLPTEDARWILPLDTMSKVVYTYTLKEWECIINMRLWDYTGIAHPDAKLVASMIKNEFDKLNCNIKQYNK